MSNLDNLRSSILLQSQPLGSKRRFGLFSQPISTAVCDNGAFKIKLHPRDQTGKPATLPRNVCVSPNRTGKLSKSYFAPLNPLASHDKHDIFIQEGLRLLKEQHSSFNHGRKETNFVPASGYKANSAYRYVEEMNPELDPRRFRQEDGRVKNNPRNICANSDSTIGDILFKHYKYVHDPYERQHQMELQRSRRSKSKEKEDAFKPNGFVPKLLNKDLSVYGSDVQLPKKQLSEVIDDLYKHENAWRPNSFAKQGVHSMFQPIHPYIESPPPQRKPKSIEKDQKQGFKGMGVSVLSTPSPSISLNRVNMIKIIRSSSPRR